MAEYSTWFSKIQYQRRHWLTSLTIPWLTNVPRESRLLLNSVAIIRSKLSFVFYGFFHAIYAECLTTVLSVIKRLMNSYWFDQRNTFFRLPITTIVRSICQFLWISRLQLSWSSVFLCILCLFFCTFIKTGINA